MIALLLSVGCRKKAPPPPEPPVTVEETPVTPEAQPAPAEAEEAPAAVAPRPFGHAPSDDEVRAALRPLLPEIGGCVKRLNPEGPVVLAFAIHPATGQAAGVQLAGKPDECAADVLRRMRLEPWSAGVPNLVQLPLTRDGQPMRETDGGLK